MCGNGTSTLQDAVADLESHIIEVFLLNSTSSLVELRRRSVYSDADATQLNSTSSWAELRRYKQAFSPLPLPSPRIHLDVWAAL